MSIIKSIIGVSAIALLSGCATQRDANLTVAQIESVNVITPDQVEYQPLNPARGDASPQAGVLWGDIRQDVPSGVLLQFAEGFASPPHIHNITYRAVVIRGEVHNDDPDAENMWMGPGSFWIQPAGEVHITSARPGVGATAFLEILEGPYLVQPEDMAFDNGERPVNIVESNQVWLTSDDLTWISADGGLSTKAEAAFLWGKPETGQLSASLIRLSAGQKASLSTVNGDLKAVMTKGELIHEVIGASEPSTVGAGGYFSSLEGINHTLECRAAESCVIYLRTEGQFRLS